MGKNKVSVVILAAGKGTRMKSTLPKVLHKISGKEMLFYTIYEAKKLSDDITVVLSHQAELIKKEMDKYFSNINYHIQDIENFPGTGGAIMGIKPKYKRTLVLNGDMPLVQAKELEKLIDKKAKLTVSILLLKNADGYGRVIIDDDEVVKIVEQKDCNKAELKVKTANGGVYCFDSKFLLNSLPKLSNNNAAKEYYITDLVEIAIKQNLYVKPVVVSEKNFKGVNSKLDLADAQAIHQKRIKKDLMKNGVIMRLPETIYIDYDVKVEGESIIENGVSLLGNSIIKDSHIKTNSVVEDAIIKKSSVGPMARIRPKTKLVNTHIGNFVETKKANLNGVKAGHLSYLGDCDIDSGTNIGAGTITCNYDGKNKYKTTIGKNVFVGSDTQLIAPVTLEDNTMVAAGSTITSNVNSGDLALSRTKQKSIKGFFYKFFGK